MTTPIDMESVVPADRILGEDEQETELLREMLANAEQYLTSFKWCPPVAEKFFGCGVGGVVAAFLFRLATKVNGTDEWLWVVVGDVPSAYLVADDAPNAAKALVVYCDLMEEWINAVRDGTSLMEVYSVAASATQDNANKLSKRIGFIREQIIPNC